MNVLRRRRSAFTLLELLVVMAIIVVRDLTMPGDVGRSARLETRSEIASRRPARSFIRTQIYPPVRSACESQWNTPTEMDRRSPALF